LLHHCNTRPHAAQATEERIQELQWNFLNIHHPAQTWPLMTSHLLGLLKSILVANVLLMMRLKRRCRSG
jgi:hypothetical protein